MQSNQAAVRNQLSIMMFLEFFLWASWYVPIGGYMSSTLGFKGDEIGWIYATTALGAIFAPIFVGFIADRWFATERVLAVLHLLGGVCLFWAAEQTEFPWLMALLVVNAMCFMPTLALVNSVAFRNMDNPNEFSRVAVWGTIGWIYSGLIVGLVIGGTTKGIFYLAGGGSLAMGLYCFTLPHTPPKRAEAGGDVLGLSALKLLKDRSFLIFALCAFLISIPLTFYFTWANVFLVQTDRPKPTALMTLAQVSEILVMIVMPWFISRIGLKKVLVIGMAAWAARFLLFGTLSFPLIILGLLLHGFCYVFVFVAAFIYVEKRTPRELTASAQSFLAFLMWGVGMFIGAKLAGWTAEQYPPTKIAAVAEDGTLDENHALPDWPADEETPGLPEALGMAQREAVPVRAVGELPAERFTLGKLSYGKADLVRAFEAADADKNGVVTRPEWRAAQANTWPPIWLWPGGLAAVVCILFFVGGREAKPEEQEGEAPEEEQTEPEGDAAAGETGDEEQPEGNSGGE